MTGLPPLARTVAATLLAATTVAFPAGSAGATNAHDGDSVLLVEPATVSAGASIRVRGDLPTTNAVDLVIEDAAGRTHSLTVVPDPPDGHFEVVVAVPTEVATGRSTLEARSAGTHLAEAEFVVTPSAPEGEDRDDASITGTGRPGAAGLPGRRDAAASQPGGAPITLWPWAIAAAGALGVGALATRRARARSRAS